MATLRTMNRRNLRNKGDLRQIVTYTLDARGDLKIRYHKRQGSGYALRTPRGGVDLFAIDGYAISKAVLRDPEAKAQAFEDLEELGVHVDA